MPINSAQFQLLDLAAAMRGDDWADDLAGALIAAKNADWKFTDAYRIAFKLLLDPEARPKELKDACQKPTVKSSGADPAVVADTLAPYRQARGWGETV